MLEFLYNRKDECAVRKVIPAKAGIYSDTVNTV